MGVRDDAIPQGFVQLLRKHRPELKRESPDVQVTIAYLVWVSPTKNRVHRLIPDHMSIHHRELETLFGRGQWKPLNDHLRIFDESPNWWLDESATKAYKLKPDLERAVSNYFTGWRRRMRKHSKRLVGLDGKRLRSIPQAVASKDMNGITAKAWDRAAVKKLVPIDRLRLIIYSKKLERMLADPQADLFIFGDVADYEYRLEAIAKILEMARERDGKWSAIQRYVESASGRLYGKNINLQTVPRSIKQVALHGLWEYDFANCHYAILYQLAAEHGRELPATAHYLNNKKAVRNKIMADLGLAGEDVKTCLIALIYGARFSHRDEDAIPNTIGKDAALRLYQHPLFKAIKSEVTEAMIWIIGKWPRSRKRLQNAYGKWIHESKSKAQILAHILQGIEAKMLATVRKLYDAEIVLLQHDGFASAVQLDTSLMSAAIYKTTGYRIQIEESHIAIAPDLGI